MYLQLYVRCLAICARCSACVCHSPLCRSLRRSPQPPGVVIDFSPAADKQYIGSPSIAILPDGSYVASHDFFSPGNQGDRTHRVPLDRSRPALAAVGRAEGPVVVGLVRPSRQALPDGHEPGLWRVRHSPLGRRRHDVDGAEGRQSGVILAEGKYHTSSMPVVVHEGRIWRAMEDGDGPGGWGSHFRAFVLSAPEDADLLECRKLDGDESPRPRSRPGWMANSAAGWKATPSSRREGTIVDILRADTKTQPEKAAIIEISADGKRATFDPATGFIDFPGGAKKFCIRYDAPSKHYWSLVNWALPKHAAEQAPRVRNTVALVRSADLRNWEIRCVLIYHPDTKFHGFQYADWLVDGDDIVAAIRTAFDEPAGQAHNQHDANYLTFHRWPRLSRADDGRFRGRSGDSSLTP